MEKSLYPRFKSAFVKEAKKLVVGNPLSKNSFLGAVVSKDHMEKILYYIDLAKKEGGKVLCGGKQVFLKGKLKDGYYVSPTVIAGLDYLCRLNQEEVFGPVLAVIPVRSIDEAVQIANRTDYGLAASLFTSNVKNAMRAARDIRAGTVTVNAYGEGDITTPFGGYKQSGFGGRDNGLAAHDQFTEMKTIWVDLSDRRPDAM